MKNKNLPLIALAAAGAFVLLGSKKTSAKGAKTALAVGEVVDAGSLDNGKFEWRVVVDELTPGFGTGANYRGEWRQPGVNNEWTACFADANPLGTPDDAKLRCLEAISSADVGPAIGDVVDSGLQNLEDSYEWRVLINSATPGFGDGYNYRGEWRKVGENEWNVCGIEGNQESAKILCLQAIAETDMGGASNGTVQTSVSLLR